SGTSRPRLPGARRGMGAETRARAQARARAGGGTARVMGRALWRAAITGLPVVLSVAIGGVASAQVVAPVLASGHAARTPASQAQRQTPGSTAGQASTPTGHPLAGLAPATGHASTSAGRAAAGGAAAGVLAQDGKGSRPEP